MSTGRAPMFFSRVAQSPPGGETHKHAMRESHGAGKNRRLHSKKPQGTYLPMLAQKENRLRWASSHFSNGVTKPLLNQEENESGCPYPPHTPWPCRGASWSRRSRTWTPRRGSLRRWGCPVPRRPAGSGSLGSGSACWSSSWRSAAVSPYGAPGTPPCGEHGGRDPLQQVPTPHNKPLEDPLTYLLWLWKEN